MATEIEAKFILSELSGIRERIKQAGGVQKRGRLLMRRRIYDYPDLRLDAQAAWVRVRDEGTRIVLSFKQRRSETLSGMFEHETTVDSFEETCGVLEAIGLTEKAYQESYRELWDLDGCELALDEWPWIPPVIEIEGESEERVQEIANRLDLDWNLALFDSIDAVYLRYYDVSRREASTVRLAFDEEPKLFTARRKNKKD